MNRYNFVWFSFAKVPVPQPPINFPLNMTVPDRLEIIQKYMNDLQYPFSVCIDDIKKISNGSTVKMKYNHKKYITYMLIINLVLLHVYVFDYLQ